MGTVGTLLCGSGQTAGIAKAALDQLSSSVDNFSTRAIQFLTNAASSETIAFGPFCARVLLENSCAALVGRLDSFRMLYLSEFQTQPEYEYGKRARSAFSWSGDVIPDEKAAQALWSLDHDIAKISRALFSRYMEHVYWKPAVERMLDYVSANQSSPEYASQPAVQEILRIDPLKYVDETRGRSAQLYSTLSKAVHWEFFTTALVFDEPTVKSAIRDACLIVGHLGLTSHFIPTAYCSLAPKQALDTYLLLRKDVP